MEEEKEEKITTDEGVKNEENKAPVTVAEAKKIELTPLQKFQQKHDVLLMLYPKDINGNFAKSITPEDEIAVYEIVKDRKIEKKSLLILLDTSGGNVYSAVKIMDTLRSKYEEIIIAIPQEAKSSGTMMCCGADKLVMGPISELGPLDKPMVHPNNETSTISALDIVKSIDGMIDTAVLRQKQLGQEINSEMRIPLKQSLEIASESISKLISPMLCKEDVKIYNQANRLLAIAENYGSEFLNKFMLKYLKDEKLRVKIAEMVIRRLVWLYPDHSFAVRRDELREWFFLIDDAEKMSYWPELWQEFRQHIGINKSKLIKFL